MVEEYTLDENIISFMFVSLSELNASAHIVIDNGGDDIGSLSNLSVGQNGDGLCLQSNLSINSGENLINLKNCYLSVGEKYDVELNTELGFLLLH